MTTIYYVGTDSTHPGDFVYDIPEGHDVWLLIVTQTPAVIWVRGELKEYPAHSAVLYPPRTKIYYRACADTYKNDWMRFDTKESYVTETTVPLGTPIQLPDPGYCHQLFQLVAAEHYFAGGYRELSIDYLLRILFNKLLEASQSPESTPHYQKLLGLRKAIYQQPAHAWTVPMMAEFAHVSPSHLQSLYKATFGVSCMEDVISCRIRLAKERLIQGQQKIADIAVSCGYRNVEHFSRQFRSLVGCTPRAFRNSVTETSSQASPLLLKL